MRRIILPVLAVAVVTAFILTPDLMSQAGDQLRRPSTTKHHSVKFRKKRSESQLADKAKNVPKIDESVADPNVDPMPSLEAKRASLSILHIGDSHTSADFFTGEIRRRLQAQFGTGGTGYITAGKPHSGVRSSTLKVTTSPGWTYASLQKPDAAIGNFWLSGYNSVATAAGEKMTFSSDQPVPFDLVEIEALRQPGGGTIEISINGTPVRQENLASERSEPRVIRIAAPVTESKLNELSIRAATRGRVILSSIAIYSYQGGLVYNSVGYIGATVSVLNKLNEKLLADDLARISPQIVVLSFGTNEGANDQLDISSYKASYEKVLAKIRRALPSVTIVMILPPDFNASSSDCRKDNIANSVCRPNPTDLSSPRGMNSNWLNANATHTPVAVEKQACIWHTPTKLAEVREAQREIAERNGLTYWNWGSLMPSECGAHQWFGMNPPLMSRDHVHLTAEGYRKSAEQFLTILMPIVEGLKNGAFEQRWDARTGRN